MPLQLHRFEFISAQWEELIAMSFEPFEFGEGEVLTRGQWMALAYMALGKAQRIDAGHYGDTEQDERVNVEEWAQQLRDIADAILNHF